MRALVTGATGFVGGHLVRRLRDEQAFVRAVVRRSGAVDGADETLTVADIGSAADWRDALRGIDTVFHLAACVHAAPGAHDAATFRRINVDAPLCLATEAAGAGVRRFVFVSTAKVAGDRSPGRPLVENDPPAPSDPYAESKWAAEQELRRLGGDIALTIVRPPLVYGPGVKANFLRLLRLAATGWPLPLAGADQPRSMVYVGNLVDALVACARHDGARGRTFFVADDEDVSPARLIARLRALRHSPARLWPVPPPAVRFLAGLAGRQGDFMRLFEPLQIDSTAIRRTLGWRAPWSLDAGLQATLDWFEATLRQAD